MKKILSFVPLLLLILFLLAGCSSNKLSSDFDQETVKTAAEDIITQMNDNDFSSILSDKSSSDLSSALSVDQLSSAKTQIMANAGEFKEFKAESIIGEKNDHEDIAVAVIIAQYENQKVTFTLGFNKDMQLCALYLK